MLKEPFLKFIGYIVAVMLAYSAIKGDVQVLQVENNYLQAQISEMKQDLRDIKIYMQALSEQQQQRNR